ncbi:TolC family protein [Algoriphagus sp. CAU 1675]|uniref:TolC family protein n=1 Tax=Algoriphagus sp. CAU 1675 TaxID=3032597 RepID=UPI0023DB79A8|nr:TolC family protein [Algoriphagus sp. CAU 1675]MDF2158122.1 TolC family protein [Algoriphagus sp. CAU 1675]
MKLYKLLIIISVNAFLGNSIYAQETLMLNFGEAVELGLKANLDYQIQQNNIEILKKTKQVAVLSHLPSVGINSNLARQTGQQFQQIEGEIVVTNVTNEIVSGGLSLNMPVFNAGKRILDTQSAKMAFEAGENGLERARQQVVFDVAQRYLQVLLDQELLRIASENLENQMQQLAQIEGFVDAGLRTVSDLYNQRSEVARVQSVKVDAQLQLENDLWSLSEYLQLDPQVVPQLEAVDLGGSEQLFKETPLGELYDLAVSNRKDLKQQELLVNSTKKNMQGMKAMYFPRVNAFYNYSTFFTSLDNRSFSEQLFQIYPQNTVGLTLTIPIFSNFQSRLNYSRAKVAYQNQQLQEKALDRKVYQEVRLAWQNYQAAVQKAENTGIQVLAAQEAKNSVQERFRLGLSNFVDLSTANQQLVSAQADQAQAVYRLYFQEVLMKFALGTLEVDG